MRIVQARTRHQFRNTHALCICGLCMNGAFCEPSHTKIAATSQPAARAWWTFWG